MLLQFSTGNYRSFQNIVTLSLEATHDSTLKEENTFLASDSLRLLKSLTIYGANASGKTNIFTAFMFMQQFVFTSSNNTQSTSPIPVEPFRLSTKTEAEPSHFEVVFMHQNTRYRYGFEVTAARVHAEWLFSSPNGKETKLFTREKDDISPNKPKFPEGKKDLIERTRSNALFLSTLAQFNGEISTKVIEWFRKTNVISGLNSKGYMDFAIDRIKDTTSKQEILQFIQSIDLNIFDLMIHPVEIMSESILPIFTEEARIELAAQASKNVLQIKTLHKKYDQEKKIHSLVAFDLANQESSGTIKLLFLAAPILDTLAHGKILFIDEMDAELHPLIMEAIIQLFNSKEKNPHNAQLLFNSQNTSLLGTYFRRDQIWFVQKDEYGASDLYSLDEYSVRKKSSYEAGYLSGIYGGIPVIENIDDTE